MGLDVIIVQLTAVLLVVWSSEQEGGPTRMEEKPMSMRVATIREALGPNWYLY